MNSKWSPDASEENGGETRVERSRKMFLGSGRELQVGCKGEGRLGRKSPPEKEETGLRGDMEEGEMIGGMTKISSWR